MNKICGKIEYFKLVEQERSRTIIRYGLKAVEGTDLYEWYEVYFTRRKVKLPTMEQAQKAVEADIDSQTDENILTGFVWNGINVYLSLENQRNFSEAQRMAESNPSILPLIFKLGENADTTPVYHTFDSVEELNGFYIQAFAYINKCLEEGWKRKDGIDWEPYKEFLDT